LRPRREIAGLFDRRHIGRGVRLFVQSDVPEKFLVTSSSQIGTIFSQIGSNLSKLRIAQ
jgi:hypothetical protein